MTTIYKHEKDYSAKFLIYIDGKILSRHDILSATVLTKYSTSYRHSLYSRRQNIYDHVIWVSLYRCENLLTGKTLDLKLIKTVYVSINHLWVLFITNIIYLLQRNKYHLNFESKCTTLTRKFPSQGELKYQQIPESFYKLSFNFSVAIYFVEI